MDLTEKKIIKFFLWFVVVSTSIFALCICAFFVFSRLLPPDPFGHYDTIPKSEPTLLPSPSPNPTPIDIVEYTPSTEQNTSVVEPTPSVGNTNFEDIVRNPDDKSWTDVQFDEYKKSIKGLRAVNWQGNVVDVKESMLGDYYIEVDMPGTEDRIDVFVYTNKDFALSLKKAQQITFSGVIDGLYLDLFEDWKVEIRDATIN